jgi:hypothetical protein
MAQRLIQVAAENRLQRRFRVPWDKRDVQDWMPKLSRTLAWMLWKEASRPALGELLRKKDRSLQTKRFLQAVSGTFPTSLNLRRWGLALADNCPLCGAPAETMAHIQCLCPRLKNARIAVHHHIWADVVHAMHKGLTAASSSYSVATEVTVTGLSALARSMLRKYPTAAGSLLKGLSSLCNNDIEWSGESESQTEGRQVGITQLNDEPKVGRKRRSELDCVTAGAVTAIQARRHRSTRFDPQAEALPSSPGSSLDGLHLQVNLTTTSAPTLQDEALPSSPGSPLDGLSSQCGTATGNSISLPQQWSALTNQSTAVDQQTASTGHSTNVAKRPAVLRELATGSVFIEGTYCAAEEKLWTHFPGLVKVPFIIKIIWIIFNIIFKIWPWRNNQHTILNPFFIRKMLKFSF